jgi:hypothetical protein
MTGMDANSRFARIDSLVWDLHEAASAVDLEAEEVSVVDLEDEEALAAEEAGLVEALVDEEGMRVVDMEEVVAMADTIPDRPLSHKHPMHSPILQLEEENETPSFMSETYVFWCFPFARPIVLTRRASFLGRPVTKISWISSQQLEPSNALRSNTNHLVVPRAAVLSSLTTLTVPRPPSPNSPAINTVDVLSAYPMYATRTRATAIMAWITTLQVA